MADDYTNTISTTGSLIIGSDITGNIETVGDQDWFKISLQANTTYQIDLKGSPTGSGTLSDTYLRGIYDSTGNSLNKSDDDGGQGYNSKLIFTPSSSADYYISAGSYSGTGTYKLSVKQNTTVGKPPIAINDNATTVEDTPVTINVLANDSDPEGSSLNIQTATAQNGVVTINSDTISYTPKAGFTGVDTIAYIIVDNQGLTSTAVATVNVNPADDYTNTIATTGMLTADSETTGKIETAGDQDWFKVSLQANTTYQIDLKGSPTGSGTLSDTYLKGIYDSTGNSLNKSDDDGGQGRNSQITFKPRTSGDYFISAGAYSSNTGTYQLALNTVSTSNNNAPILLTKISDQSIKENAAFSLKVTDNFKDNDIGDTLSYSVTLADGTQIPSWLSFNANTQTFSGTPKNTDIGTLNVKVIVTDAVGAQVSDTFDLTINRNNSAIFTGDTVGNANQNTTTVLDMQKLEAINRTDGNDWAPQVTSLNNGKYVVVWSGSDSHGDYSIFVQRFDASGNKEGSITQLEALNRLDGKDEKPRVAQIGTDGSFVVTWEGKDLEGDVSIFVQRFDANGNKLGNTTQLEALNNTDGSDNNPEVISLGTDGRFVVTWQGEDRQQGDNSIFVQRFDASGNKAGNTIMLEAKNRTDGHDNTPKLAELGQDGRFVVTWWGQDGEEGDFSIFVQRFDASGNKEGNIIQLEALNKTYDYDSYPNITELNDGFAIAWSGKDTEGDMSIFVQRFDTNGNKVNNTIQLEALNNTSGNDFRPEITALGSNGKFAVTWYGEDRQGDDSIFVQRFDATANKQGTTIQLEAIDKTNGTDNYPVISPVGDDGSFVIAWSGNGKNEKNFHSVFVQRFDANGNKLDITKLDAQEQLNNNNSSPEVTKLGTDGSFVVTWDGGDPENDSSVFVQRFDANGKPIMTTKVETVVSGKLTVSDADGARESKVIAQTDTNGDYGSFSIDSNGNWKYQADEANAALKANPAGGVLQETFVVKSVDGTAQPIVININGTNDAPTLENDIPDQTINTNTTFNFSVPTNSFKDIDTGDVLTYAATLADGSELPNWLAFNTSTQTFSGTPLNEHVGTLNLKVIATDNIGAKVSDTFNITVNGNPTGQNRPQIEPDTATMKVTDFSSADIHAKHTLGNNTEHDTDFGLKDVIHIDNSIFTNLDKGLDSNNSDRSVNGELGSNTDSNAALITQVLSTLDNTLTLQINDIFLI